MSRERREICEHRHTGTKAMRNPLCQKANKASSSWEYWKLEEIRKDSPLEPEGSMSSMDNVILNVASRIVKEYLLHLANQVCGHLS